MIVVIVLTVLLAVALYFYMRKKKPSGPYRLADLIFYPSWIVTGDTGYMLDEYPDSIGVKYTMKRFPCLRKGDCTFEDDTIVDTKLLTSIIQSDPDYEKYSHRFSDDEIVLHVRIGDVLCKKDENFFETGKTFGSVYAKYGDTAWWEDVKGYILSSGIQTVYLMYGSHTGDCTQESEEYIRSIKEMLRCKVVDVNNTADQDLIFCTGAKHFITTGGGYGLLLGELVEKNGGRFQFRPERTVSDSDRNDVKFV